ncbi:hypothetical protein PM082_023411 [Marasmius tenuissimus]|nr:hypothetical protein PM082_023411 [Marasmius tenuissimus]
MARKRLYRTRQEQRAANNLASKRYRERHADELRERRQAQIRLEEENRSLARKAKQKRANGNVRGKEKSDTGDQSNNDKPRWAAEMAFIRQVHQEFVSLVKNRGLFVDDIYWKFITPVPYEGYLPASFLDEANGPFKAWSREIKNVQRRMYYHCGVTAQWKESEELRADIDDVVRWIDDIYCAFLEGGILGLQEAYYFKQLGHTQHM